MLAFNIILADLYYKLATVSDGIFALARRRPKVSAVGPHSYKEGRTVDQSPVLIPQSAASIERKFWYQEGQVIT